ncbi:MAG: multiheme c-type cytochrome, partial [Candidatus Poribacteria bacterium]|nr:multiheme c-type cytochrome [Candidatus Poribacteria bacterium]
MSEFKSDEPPAVVILHTGGTKSYLEPCGCYQEQSGGLPRRAYVVNQIRQQGFATLFVDTGNIFDGKAEIDAKRCEVNLKAMSAMGYDAVALSQADISYGDAYLSRQHNAATFPFLAPAQNDFTHPSVIKQIGQHTIAFVTGELSEEAIRHADLVVALGTRQVSKYVDVVIQPNEIETTKSEDKTLYVGSKPEGKTLGLLALWLDSNGELTRDYATQLALTGDVPEDESVRQLLTDFYREVAEASEHQPLFAEQLLEQQRKNGYVSASTCQDCHEQEYLQWSATRHAFAFETL